MDSASNSFRLTTPAIEISNHEQLSRKYPKIIPHQNTPFPPVWKYLDFRSL